MVKLALSFAALAAIVASVASAPSQSPMMSHLSLDGPNKCIPETSLKEYHPFALLSSKLQTLVSKGYKSPLLVGGVSGSKAYQQLDFCIVSTTQECSKSIPSNCIYENVEYRFRVNGPEEGYLRIKGNYLDIVSTFEEASGLNLYKEPGWGLRVSHVNNFGHRTILATNGGGHPLTMEEFKANDARQWFQIVEANNADVDEEDREAMITEPTSCLVPSSPNQCVPETSIKEYHPFALLSSKLNTLVSRPYKFPYLVGGVSSDSKAFQELNFCIVSSTQGCSKSIPSNCIYENVEYRFRVDGPEEGYLRIVGGHLDIVPHFKDASGLNLYKEAGWGLRVAHVDNFGHRTVLATNGGGFPLSMEEFKANDARQWFQILEANKAEKPYRRF
ncbi:hypothetical protein EC968_007892 [Mortierella alpina]|nr:hypothetical protein EC968_007892 [Mortierella alpina]